MSAKYENPAYETTDSSNAASHAVFQHRSTKSRWLNIVIFVFIGVTMVISITSLILTLLPTNQEMALPQQSNNSVNTAAIESLVNQRKLEDRISQLEDQTVQLQRMNNELQAALNRSETQSEIKRQEMMNIIASYHPEKGWYVAYVV